MRWNPSQYTKFAGPRLQPGLDLVARVPAIEARCLVDLGCGTGEITAALAERFPLAMAVGLDSSEEMLGKARERFPALVWERGDIAQWSIAEPVHVLFSNAALQWLDDHERLFARLLSHVAPGGVFAVQMPRNFAAPSHQRMREIAKDARWAGKVKLREEPVLSPERYYELLRPHCSELEIWETEYLHVLEGEDPVLEWTKGTALLPVTSALTGAERDAFVERYRDALREAYPRRSDGRTLFPFRRIFLLARR
jgi:trans-aconitate 2-methyltransferase